MTLIRKHVDITLIICQRFVVDEMNKSDIVIVSAK